MTLEEIIEDFNTLKKSFRDYTSHREINRGGLNEFQHKFIDLLSEIRPYKSQLTSSWVRRDDKAATAIKSRIALAIHDGSFEGFDQLSINQAEKCASGTEQYKQFLEERAVKKSSLSTIIDLREDIKFYVNLTKDYLKDVELQQKRV